MTNTAQSLAEQLFARMRSTSVLLWGEERTKELEPLLRGNAEALAQIEEETMDIHAPGPDFVHGPGGL